MNKNKKMLFLAVALVTVLILVSAVNATNDTDKSIDKTISEKTSTQASNIIKEKTTPKEKNEINKKEERNATKKQSTIILNRDTYNQYVTDGKLNDNVTSGDTIDIQGYIVGDGNSLEINKPVNIISSTNDAVLAFSTKRMLNIAKDGAGTNLTDIKFENTHFQVYNTSNVKINNISLFNGPIPGHGCLSVREGSDNITITNSYFKTQANGGVSNVVFAAAYNCLFENNTIEGYGDQGLIGNLLYLTTYNVGYADYKTNENITIRNNSICSYIPAGVGMGTCWGLVLEGSGHLIENNYINAQVAVNSQYADSSYNFETNINNIIFRNNYVAYGGPHLDFPGEVYNNTVIGGVTLGNIYAYNNNFETVRITNHVKFENNTAKTIIINGNNSNITFPNGDNILDSLSINGNNNTLKNLVINTTEDIIITGYNNTLTDSTVYSNQLYAIQLNNDNNTVKNNYIFTGRLNGDNAVKDLSSTNNICDNTPIESAKMYWITEENYFDYFDDNGYIKNIDNLSIVTLYGDFNNKDFIFENIELDIFTEGKVTLYNSTVTINGTSEIKLAEFYIDNRQSDKKQSLIIDSNNNVLNKVYIFDSNYKSQFILITVTGDNNIVNYNFQLHDVQTSEENPSGIFLKVNSKNNTFDAGGIMYRAIGSYIGALFTEESEGNTLTGTPYYHNMGSVHDTYGIIISGNNHVIDVPSIWYVPNILTNANNTIIHSTTYIESLILNNSNFNNITDCKTIHGINLINSNNNIIQYCSDIKSENEKTIVLTNSSNNIITQNKISCNQSNGGDYAVGIDELSKNNTIYKNRDMIVTLNDETYDSLFTENIFTGNGNIIEVDSDLFNRTLIFNEDITLNANNYAFYDSVIIANNTRGTTTINNLKLNATNIPSVIILNGSTTLKSVDIFQKNTNIITKPIYNNNVTVTLNNVNIKVISDSDIIGLSGKFSQSNSLKLNLTGDNVIGINLTENYTYSINPTITINANNAMGILNNNSIYVNENKRIRSVTIDITANDSAIGFFEKNSKTNYERCTVNINSPNAIAFYLDNFQNRLYQQTMTLNGNNATGIKITNIYNPVTIQRNTININGNNAVGIEQIKTYAKITTTQNTININTEEGYLITLDTAYEGDITSNTMTINTKEKSIILKYSENIKITGNTINNEVYMGNIAIEEIYSTGTIIENNLPKVPAIITNENYDEYFQDSIYIGSNESIWLGSDIYDKDFIITKAIEFYGKGYTIYNGTIKLQDISSANTLQNITIDNTESTKLAFISNSPVTFSYNTIINGTILLENCTTASTLSNNNFNVCGDNLSVIYANNFRITFQYNSILMEGNNNTAIFIGNMTTRMNVRYNDITSKSEEATTLVLIDTARVYFNNNQILSNTTQGETPLVKVITTTNGQVNNNYIESLDLVGDDAVSTPGTKSGNTPTTTGYQATMNIETNEFTVYIINEINVTVRDLFNNTITGTITATVDGENIEVIDNQILYYTTTPGTKNLVVTFTDPEGKYSTITQTQPITITIPESETELSSPELTLGGTTNMSATFYTDEGIQVTNGKAIFRVNGKTLRDNEGNVIYVDVVEGVAQLPDVNITQEWNKPDTTIQAVYCGNDEFEPIYTEATSINITKPEATITIEAPEQATAGQTITLTARVTDGDKAVNSGRVAFKLNGKTLKNAEGKALYAEVKDGIATITYTIPAKTKAKEYTLTAVFTDTVYDRVEAESKLNVVKA